MKKVGKKILGARNITGNKAIFKAENRPLYEYTAANATFSGRAKIGRHFVYVLLFNLNDDNLPEIPFFVGETNKLTLRMENHKFATWHVDRFNRPVRVKIVASVPEVLARAAAADLTGRFLRHRALLKNVPADHAGHLGRRTDAQIEEYLTTAGNPESIYVAWQKFWQQRENERTLPTAEVKEAPSVVTYPDVINYISKRNYTTSWASLFSRKLAAAYDPFNRTSRIMLPYHENIDTRQRMLIQLAENLAGVKGDWFTQEPLRLDAPLIFHLAEQARRSIETDKNKRTITPGTRNKVTNTYTAAEIMQHLLRTPIPLDEQGINFTALYYFDEAKQSALVPVTRVASEGVRESIWSERGKHPGYTVYTLTVEVQQMIREYRKVEGAVYMEVPGTTILSPAIEVKKKVLLKYVNALNFPTLTAKKLAMELAHNYNPASLSSQLLSLKTQFMSSTVAKENLEADALLISSIWFTNDPLTPEAKFYLRGNIIKSLIG